LILEFQMVSIHVMIYAHLLHGGGPGVHYPMDRLYAKLRE
jgi:hypothetical protein